MHVLLRSRVEQQQQKKFAEQINGLVSIWERPPSWKSYLVCMKAEAHTSAEPPLEYNQHQRLLTNEVWLQLFKQT